ncbi:MAG TPA: cation-translocating P-type ATPase [Candidatus Limnocylindrales bacterium]|nr:cation-translocating P-type ATPase [Candidatus Limnocylindrales bacterium]
MTSGSKHDCPPEPGTKPCLARSVVDALAEDPTLEAVTIDRERKTISVATLGKADVPKLTERISRTFERAQSTKAERGCTLLAGHGECRTCVDPLPDLQRQKILIQHDGEKTTIARVTCPTAPKFWRWRDIPFPKLVQRDIEFLEHAEELDEWKPQLAAAILCGVFGLGAYLSGSPHALLGYLLAYVAGGWYTVQEIWERLQKGTIDVHFLMLAVAVGSASIGAWGEGAMLLFLFSFSGALEHYALGRTQREIRSLFRDAPKFATVLDESGHEREMPVESLRPSMRLLIKPGAQFPVDAEVIKGQTASDESNLTGEAAPVEKAVGDSVLAGTMNLWGAVEVAVLRSATESALQKIIRLIREAQRQKAPAQQFTDRFSTYYTYSVLGLSAAMFFVWWLGFGQAPFGSSSVEHSAFYHTMTLLVVASPCALVLSIPSAVLAAIAWSARHGILFRGGAAVEKLAEVTTVALDKTGTLTTGELAVERIESFPPGREAEVGQLAFCLERLSTHPLARAITRFGKQQGFSKLELEGFESITGHGLRANYQGQECRLGRREWFAQVPLATTIAKVPATESGLAEVWLNSGDLLGRIVLRDDIRAEAKGLIEELHQEGLHAVVLTGDRKAAAEGLQRALGIKDVRAELKPEQKVSAIRALTGEGLKVAMVGDGVNDAPSLAAAHIGVAMGARGSDAALEQADVVLMHDRLENFLAAFRLSQRARRVIRQNLFISLGTVVVLVTFALLGRIPLTIGVVGHEGSTVVVVMNSLRLLLGSAAPRHGKGE